MSGLAYWCRILVWTVGRLSPFIAAWILDYTGHHDAATAIMLVTIGWLGHFLWADFRRFRASYLEWRRRTG